MKKLNLSTEGCIVLDLSDEIDNYLPVVFAWADIYSWHKAKYAQKMFEATIEVLIEFYKKSKNLDNFMNNIGSIWNMLINYISEEHLKDFLQYGYLNISKDNLMQIYEEYRDNFEEGYLDVVQDWYNSEKESIEKQSYRHLRKETRGRVSGIGFGLTGGLKAAVGSGLGNLASGMAHGVFNAIANGVDNISNSVKYDNMYKDDKTLTNLVNGWRKTYWLIYNCHIQNLNQIIVEEGTSYILDYSELKTRELEASQEYSNLLKANLSPDDNYNHIVELIYKYPFELKYWESYLYLLSSKITFSINVYNKIISFLKKADEDFYKGFYLQLAPITVSMLLKKYTEDDIICNDEENEDIIDIIKNYNNNDSNTISNAIAILFDDAGYGIFDIQSLFSLFSKIGLNINDLLKNDNIKEKYNNKMEEISMNYVGLNYEKMILPAIKNGNIEVIANDMLENNYLEIETTLRIIIAIISKEIKENKLKDENNNILDNIDKLINKLNINTNLYDKKSPPNDTEQEAKAINIKEQTEIENEPQEETAPAVKKPEKNKLSEGASEERYYYLREEDRIYTALKFKERKGFFRRILPASWFLTIVFYGVISFIALVTSVLLTNISKNETAEIIVVIVFISVVPITLFIIGIKKRLKYLREKKKWKECTASGKSPLELVYKEFQEMESEYRIKEERSDGEQKEKS